MVTRRGSTPCILKHRRRKRREVSETKTQRTMSTTSSHRSAMTHTWTLRTPPEGACQLRAFTSRPPALTSVVPSSRLMSLSLPPSSSASQAEGCVVRYRTAHTRPALALRDKVPGSLHRRQSGQAITEEASLHHHTSTYTHQYQLQREPRAQR